MRGKHLGWSMPQVDAQRMLRLIEQRIATSDIEVRHKDALIRLRQLLEEEIVEDAEGEAAENHREAASVGFSWIRL